jgi:competence protein ComEC
VSKYPLTKFTLLFILGIILESFSGIDSKALLVAFSISVTLLITLSVLKISKQLDKTIMILLTIILFGGTYYSIYTLNSVRYPFENPKYKNVAICGTITKIELLRGGRLSFQITADTIYAANKKYFGSFEIITSIYDSTQSLGQLYNQLNIGNKIRFQATMQKPRDQRNPYEFNYEKYLNARRKIALASCYDANKILIVSNKLSPITNTVFKIRKYLDEVIDSVHNRTTGSMLRGLILADRSGIDTQINQDFINAGVVHVLSVSGLHVGYVVIIFLFLFNRMNLYWRIGLTITGLFIYMIITGSEAPVFRSTVMASVILIAPIAGRESNSYNTLSLAALIILLLNPVELFNPSFQLSFSAILSLIILFPKLKRVVESWKVKSRWMKYLLMFFGSTLAAQIGTLPFTLVYFGRISITSMLANLFVIPVSGLIVGLGIVSIIVFHISLNAAIIFGSCNELLTYIMLSLVRIFGNPKYSFITINQFSTYDSFLFYLCLGICVSQFHHFARKLPKVIFVVLIISIFLIYSRLDDYELLPPNKLSVLTIDVGQGESILIKFPNGQTALIDAGDANERFDNGKRIIGPLLDKLGISTVDFGFTSHVDGDHYLGFYSLIKEGRIKRIFKPALDVNEVKDRNYEFFLKKMGVSIAYYHRKIMQIGNTRIYVLNDSSKQNQKISSNDKSGMLKLVYGSSSFLFTGDASIKAENDYMNRFGHFMKSDVLKVAHHGSKSSSSKKFIGAVSPKYAIISVGIMNKFKHPSGETLSKLIQSSAKIYRTDFSGAILIESDGKGIKLINWKNN